MEKTTKEHPGQQQEARMLLGKPVADAIMERVKTSVQDLKASHVTPGLAFVRVGARPDDCAYERMAKKRAEDAGVATYTFELADDVSQDEIVATIAAINQNDAIHGCLVFRPVPLHIDEAAICEALDPRKDIDGITRASMASIYAGEGAGFAPCTAQACVELLDYYGVALTGARVAVVGRSLVIGRPLALMLANRNATVTLCHSRTKDLASEMSAVDIVVCATGRARAYGAECFKPGQTVVDVGINFTDDGTLCGDVHFEQVAEIVDAITPVPRGVGSITTAVLMDHVVAAARQSV